MSFWSDLYSESAVVSTTVTVLHIVAMLIGGGLAISADRATLRDEPIPDVHKNVIGALTVMAVTGVLMALGDLDEFLANPMFWVKLALVALLLINGAFVYKRGGKRYAKISYSLWVLTAIAGVVLTNV